MPVKAVLFSPNFASWVQITWLSLALIFVLVVAVYFHKGPWAYRTFLLSLCCCSSQLIFPVFSLLVVKLSTLALKLRPSCYFYSISGLSFEFPIHRIAINDSCRFLECWLLEHIARMKWHLQIARMKQCLQIARKKKLVCFWFWSSNNFLLVSTIL